MKRRISGKNRKYDINPNKIALKTAKLLRVVDAQVASGGVAVAGVERGEALAGVG
jgi:hypothetical protein